MVSILKAVFVVVLLAYFFYRSIWAVIPLSVVGVFFLRQARVRRARQSREELHVQFKEFIISIAFSVFLCFGGL